MNLLKICYKDIDNEFSFAIFHVFHIVVNKKTGKFNASKLCSDWNKNIQDCKNLEKMTILYSSKNAILNGYYLNEEYLLPLCQWIYPEFNKICFKIIKDYFVNDFNFYKNNEEKIEIKLLKIQNLIKRESNKNDDITKT